MSLKVAAHRLRRLKPAPTLVSISPKQPLRNTRFGGADEGAHEFTVDLRRDGIDVDALAAEKRTGIVNLVNPRRLDADVLKSRRRQLGPVFVFFQGAGDT